MTPSRSGSLHFFTFRGIDVSIHWMWFLVAAYQIQYRSRSYGSPIWNVYEYLALFGIVLLHEFGHSLACRQVGGTANRIVLWPLGGVAFVSPPQRPGAILWSIAAGPLVNVALIPVFLLALGYVRASTWASADLIECVRMLRNINYGLLLFNMLPIYPLDGGQILQALLWFVMGRARSLFVVTIIGALAGLGVLYWAWETQSLWTGLIGLFILIQCKSGFLLSRQLAQYVLGRCDDVLWPDAARHVRALLDDGRLTDAIALYFERTGARWERERLELVTLENGAYWIPDGERRADAGR